ncbi:hypothetical protein D915_000192 [Fasciola hepatica]|uniref:Uncharacterized protein n=1 Tax=Fasciola hepatica TaxID=6192 RepID=A0A4E0RPJ6_FASHE|nr:hypothetical protein D915_000192 [Fasciola hepatica]
MKIPLKEDWFIKHLPSEIGTKHGSPGKKQAAKRVSNNTTNDERNEVFNRPPSIRTVRLRPRKRVAIPS